MGQRGVSREVRKCFKLTANENATHLNLRGAAKGRVRGKFIGLNPCFRRRSQFNLSFHIKNLGKRRAKKKTKTKTLN